ncbi:uncharacterized protein ACBR49_002787 isoform 2-T2 [Aulostomus maculatus]
MTPGQDLPVDDTEEPNNQSEGSASLKSTPETLPACDPIKRGNTTPADLITNVSQGATGVPQCDIHKPTCPRCGLTIPDDPPLCPSLSQTQGSSSSVHTISSSSRGKRRRRRRRSRGSSAGSQQPAANSGDSCFHLLLACLSCQCSVLFLGLLEACSSCLHNICSSCCHACSRCCSAIQEAPVEELNCHAHCHSVLFESCCEPTECLEFCLDCCEICHRS